MKDKITTPETPTVPPTKGGEGLVTTICSLPAKEEILAHRRVMIWAVGGDPTDDDVIADLTEEIPDTGGTLLGEMRAAKALVSLHYAHSSTERK